jgi:hypothetical protein
MLNVRAPSRGSIIGRIAIRGISSIKRNLNNDNDKDDDVGENDARDTQQMWQDLSLAEVGNYPTLLSQEKSIESLQHLSSSIL